MGVIDTGLNLKGARGIFFQRLAEIRKASWAPDLMVTEKSTTDTERYRWVGQVPNVREWGTGRKAKGLYPFSYDVVNRKWENTLEVDRDELADDQLGQIRQRIQDLAERAARHPEYLIAQLLINGGTSGYNSYDALTYFNDAHAIGAASTQDNNLTCDISSVDVPTVADCLLSFKAGVAAFMGFTDDQGEPLHMDGNGITIMVHPTPYLTWLEAMTSKLISNSDNVALKFQPRVIPVPWFTDVSMHYFLKPGGGGHKPFLFQVREPLSFDTVGTGSEEEFHREKYYYGTRARYELTYARWETAIRCNFV